MRSSVAASAMPQGKNPALPTPPAHDPQVVICGGGIVGASLAYHLTKKGVRPIVIERTGVGAAASGKAGGFLARGWGDGGPTQQLHHLSFDMHANQAKELNVMSYRRIPTLKVSGGKRRVQSPPASWLDGEVSSASMMDPDTAQVTPLELTTKLMEAAVAAGARLQIGAVLGVDTTSEGEDGGGDAGVTKRRRRVTGVRVRVGGGGGGGGEEGEVVTLPASQVAICMGPWSVLAEDWLGKGSSRGGGSGGSKGKGKAVSARSSSSSLSFKVPLEGVKSTSLVYSSNEVKERVTKEPYALFCGEDRNGCHLEVYPRWNGEVYICGCGGSDYVSGSRLREGGDCEHQGLVEADPGRVKAASSSFSGLTSLGQGGPDLTQACMRPCAPDALPMMGRIPSVEGAFLAAGHNCWGILWAPVSGLAMAELMTEGEASSVDLRAFDPARFSKGGRGGNWDPSNSLDVDDEEEEGEGEGGGGGGRGRHAGAEAVGEQW